VKRAGALRDAAVVDIISVGDAPGYDSQHVVAQPLLDGLQSNVRIIRLTPGQKLPPHRHGSSDLMLFVVEGEGVLVADGETVPFPSGSLAFYRGDEELHVSNEGTTGLTMLAFLAPPFPARRSK
jgi:quercetin dioxygenase-like cupin family protein